MSRARRAIGARVSPALAVASVALAVGLGGTGYAAFKLPANSVGPVPLRKNAVTSLKMKNASLLAADFAHGQLTAGPQGATGAPGTKGDEGDKGDTGPVGVTGHQRVGGGSTSIAAGTTKTLTAMCPGGKRVLGVGVFAAPCRPTSRSLFPRVRHGLARGREEPDRWSTAQAYAVCANVAP